ncbi:MAG: hypothetical protein Q9207_006699 [Kuettlingeria erythrocarpa]
MLVEGIRAKQWLVQSSQAGVSSPQTAQPVPEVTGSSVIGSSTFGLFGLDVRPFQIAGIYGTTPVWVQPTASTTGGAMSTTVSSNPPGNSMRLTSTLDIELALTSPGPTVAQSSVTGAFDNPNQTETTIIAGGRTLQYSKETIGSLSTLTAPATITTPIIETDKDGSIFTIPAAVIIIGPGGTWWNAGRQGFQVNGPSCLWPFCPPTGGGHGGGKGSDKDPKDPGSPKKPEEKSDPDNQEKQSKSTNSRPESQEAQSTSGSSSSPTTADSPTSTSSTSSSTSSSTIPTQVCSPDCARCNADPLNSELKMHRRKTNAGVTRSQVNSLSPRTLKTPASYEGNVEAFFLGEYQFAQWLDVNAGRSTGLIQVLGNKREDVALHGLRGCTSVVVVSKVGVWISHFWQIPSFRADPDNHDEPRTDLDIANFNEQVIQEMQDGGPNIPGLNPLTAPGGIFDEVFKPRWTIVTPRDLSGVVGSWRYQPEVDEIHGVLVELFPNAPPSIIDYEPKGDDDSQTSTASGKILFQYDPFEKIVQDPNRPCDVYQLAMYRLWVEDRRVPAWQGSWAALPGQIISDFSTYNPNYVPDRKRYNGAACEIPSNLPQASTDTSDESQPFSPPPNADETHWMTLSPSTLAMTTDTSSFPLALSGPSTLMTSVTSLSCSLNGAPWFSPASWCECGPSPYSIYPTISTVDGASSANCAYRTRPPSMITPVTISAVPTNIPGQGGIPGCAPVMYPNGQACIDADYCNCGGTPAPFLTTTFSGTLTTDCGYTIQPTSSSCPPPTTTMPPPTPPPEPPAPTGTVSCNVDSPDIDASIINSLITDLCASRSPYGLVPKTLDAANPTADVLDCVREWDENHPVNEVFVSLVPGRPDDCDTATVTFVFADREAECSKLLASVTASCGQRGGLLQGKGCLDWGVAANPVLDGFGKPPPVQY